MKVGVGGFKGYLKDPSKSYIRYKIYDIRQKTED